MSRIVIIGGMGPQASLELHRRIIASASLAGAQNNEDYPEILHASIPITDFISSGDSTKGFQELARSIDLLQLQEDDSLIIACNTVHLLLPELEARYSTPFISLVDATKQKIDHERNKIVGLLASPTTIKSKLYATPLNRIGCSLLLPTNAEIYAIEQGIRHIIANGEAEKVRKHVEPIIARMINEGAEKIILGCTELSIVFRNSKNDRLVDPLDVVCSHFFTIEPSKTGEYANNSAIIRRIYE